MIEGTGRNKCWRNLSRPEMRRLTDIPGECVYEYSGDDQKGLIPDLAAYVEYALQHIVAHPVITENDRRIVPLQRVPGTGTSTGEAPFKVGCTITVLNNDGSIKLDGAIFARHVPYGLQHKNDVGKVKKPRKKPAPRVSESPQLEVLVDTDEDGDSTKPARKFRRLSYGVSVDKYDEDANVLVKSNGKSGDDESDDESESGDDESDDESVVLVPIKNKNESDDESESGDDESDDESVEVVPIKNKSGDDESESGDDESGDDESGDESEVESAEGDNTSDYDPDEAN
jgi:hypothetical protein